MDIGELLPSMAQLLDNFAFIRSLGYVFKKVVPAATTGETSRRPCWPAAASAGASSTAILICDLDLAKESRKLRDRYGRNSFGQSCLRARRLVEAGVRLVNFDVTLQCAQCHDHLFEPLWQEEYYRLPSFFILSRKKVPGLPGETPFECLPP
jgi:Protein of unknown function (DUF1549)/Protein of unknown function (DUF1501)